MKKTLAAVAVLGAFAGSALAADVTLYGRVDGGLAYKHDGVAKTDSWGMMSGQSTGSRWGIKGSEELGNGMKAGFQLEGGFTMDDGHMGQGWTGEEKSKDRIFGREARVFLATEFGTLHFGRMGTLNSGSGSVDLLGGITAFGTGWGDSWVIANVDYGMHRDTRRDNTITYESPKMAGVKAYAQASLKKNEQDDGKEASNQAERYYALGATYDVGAFHGAAVVAQYDVAGENDANMDYLVGGSYDFGAVKVFASANYYDMKVEDDSKYGLMVGVKVPCAGGTFLANVGYTDQDEADTQTQTYAVAYEYPFSKTVSVYAGVGYNQEEVKSEKTVKDTIAMGGMVVKF